MFNEQEMRFNDQSRKIKRGSTSENENDLGHLNSELEDEFSPSWLLIFAFVIVISAALYFAGASYWILAGALIAAIGAFALHVVSKDHASRRREAQYQVFMMKNGDRRYWGRGE